MTHSRKRKSGPYPFVRAGPTGGKWLKLDHSTEAFWRRYPTDAVRLSLITVRLRQIAPYLAAFAADSLAAPRPAVRACDLLATIVSTAASVSQSFDWLDLIPYLSPRDVLKKYQVHIPEYRGGLENLRDLLAFLVALSPSQLIDVSKRRGDYKMCLKLRNCLIWYKLVCKRVRSGTLLIRDGTDALLYTVASSVAVTSYARQHMMLRVFALRDLPAAIRLTRAAFRASQGPHSADYALATGSPTAEEHWTAVLDVAAEKRCCKALHAIVTASGRLRWVAEAVRYRAHKLLSLVDIDAEQLARVPAAERPATLCAARQCTRFIVRAALRHFETTPSKRSFLRDELLGFHGHVLSQATKRHIERKAAALPPERMPPDPRLARTLALFGGAVGGDCTICCEPVTAANCYLFPCSCVSVYHATCFAQWARAKTQTMSCPTCRLVVARVAAV